MSGRTPEAAVETRLLVAFEPHGVKIAAQPGASLADLAGEAGVTVETPCGGQGRCGRCKVRFADPAAARSAFRVRSSAHLKPEEEAEGYVLACQTFVAEVTGAPPLTADAAVAEDRLTAAATDEAAAVTEQALTAITVVAPRLAKTPLFVTGHAAAKPEALPVSCDWRSNPAVRTFVRRDQATLARRPDDRLRPAASGDQP